MFPLIALAIAMQAPIEDCPPRGSAARDRLTNAGVQCADDVREEAAEQRKAAALIKRGRDFKDRVPPPSLQAKVRRFMDREVLLDGLSARYEFPPWKHPHFYCFRVNAKNSMGAYTGWTDYGVVIGSDDTTLALIDAENCDVLE